MGSICTVNNAKSAAPDAAYPRAAEESKDEPNWTARLKLTLQSSVVAADWQLAETAAASLDLCVQGNSRGAAEPGQRRRDNEEQAGQTWINRLDCGKVHMMEVWC